MVSIRIPVSWRFCRLVNVVYGIAAAGKLVRSSAVAASGTEGADAVSGGLAAFSVVGVWRLGLPAVAIVRVSQERAMDGYSKKALKDRHFVRPEQRHSDCSSACHTCQPSELGDMPVKLVDRVLIGGQSTGLSPGEYIGNPYSTSLSMIACVVGAHSKTISVSPNSMRSHVIALMHAIERMSETKHRPPHIT